MNPHLSRLHPRRFPCAFAGLIISVAPFCRAQVASPASGSAAIPDPVALFKDVQAHQSQLDAIRENYTFHEIVRTDTLDGNGAVKGTTTEEHEVFFVNGHRIRRLVKKDGVELNAREQERAQARVKKQVETEMKSTPGGAGGRRPSLIREIVAVAKTSNPRRISFRGRQTLAFDFAGDPAASAHSREQSAAKKLAGTLWIDEADRQVARLEVRFYDNFRIGGGLLLSVQKGTSIEVDQSPLGDGLWMQTASEQHVAARLLVKNFRENIHIQDFDFRKFDIGTVQQIHAPARKD